jgi:hypothetical protein
MGRTPPGKLTRRLSKRQIQTVTTWWQSLTPRERASLREHRSALEVVARFEEPGERDDGEIPDDFYEYLVAHEVSLFPLRTFHICSAHEEASAVVLEGRIPATFHCPWAKAECPMRVLLAEAPGKDVHLSLKRRCA